MVVGNMAITLFVSEDVCPGGDTWGPEWLGSADMWGPLVGQVSSGLVWLWESDALTTVIGAGRSGHKRRWPEEKNAIAL